MMSARYRQAFRKTLCGITHGKLPHVIKNKTEKAISPGWWIKLYKIILVLSSIKP